MKICYVTTSFIRSPTDYYSYFIYEQAMGAVQSRPDIDVTVVAPHAPGFKLNEEIGGIHVRRFPYFLPLQFQKVAYQTDGLVKTVKRSVVAMISFPFFLLNMCLYVFWHSRKATMIHAQWIPTAFLSLPAKWIWGVPIAVSARGSDLHSLRNSSERTKRVFKYFLNKLDVIFTVSKDFEKAFKDELKVSIPVHPLFNGVDDSFFKKMDMGLAKTTLKLDPDRAYILFVGNILQSKGVDTLLEAFKVIAAKFVKVDLLLAGEGPELKKFKKMAADLSISDRVRFMDLVPRALIPTWMGAAEMLVLPSRAEGRPNVVLEAMSCELPVVATHVGGTKELISHEKSGLLFDPGDAKILTKYIEQLLTNKEQATKLSKNAKQSLSDQGLTWRLHGEKLANYYAKYGRK